MPLTANVRHLEEREVLLKGELPVSELCLDLQDELIRAERPLEYDLRLEKMEESILVQGVLRLVLDCECARCLRPFQFGVHLPNWAVLLPLEGEDKVSLCNDLLDLTPFVREDMLLEFPQHPLCRPECPGLKKSSERGGERRSGSGESPKPQAGSDVWTGLDKLKL